MVRKKSESEFAKFANNLDIWTHKFKDQGIGSCPVCHASVTLYKSVRAVDYQLILPSNEVVWVEVKSDPKSYPWANEERGVRPGQREFMQSWLDRGVACYFALSIGDGRAPDGRAFYLVPWDVYLGIEKIVEEAGLKSIPWKENIRKISKTVNCELLFDGYQLNWEDGKWILPDNHIFQRKLWSIASGNDDGNESNGKLDF